MDSKRTEVQFKYQVEFEKKLSQNEELQDLLKNETETFQKLKTLMEERKKMEERLEKETKNNTSMKELKYFISLLSNEEKFHRNRYPSIKFKIETIIKNLLPSKDNFARCREKRRAVVKEIGEAFELIDNLCKIPFVTIINGMEIIDYASEPSKISAKKQYNF